MIIVDMIAISNLLVIFIEETLFEIVVCKMINSLFRPKCVNIYHISHEIIPWDITKADNFITKVNSNGNTNLGNMADMVHRIVADDTLTLCTLISSQK